MIMAILWTSDEMFLAGVGETKRAAADALFADPRFGPDAVRNDDALAYIPMAERPTGWSVSTDDELP